MEISTASLMVILIRVSTSVVCLISGTIVTFRVDGLNVTPLSLPIFLLLNFTLFFLLIVNGSLKLRVIFLDFLEDLFANLWVFHGLLGSAAGFGILKSPSNCLPFFLALSCELLVASSVVLHVFDWLVLLVYRDSILFTLR